MTLLDKSNRSMLVIESKSRRISARTRFQLTEEILDGNLASAYEALQKLPQKIEALYGNLIEYNDIQALIDSTKANDPICVVVLSDSLMRMSELVRLSMEGDPEHFLNGYPYRFCILGIETFERAVTLARSQNIPLYSLLAEHYEKCGESAMADASADRFSSHKGGRCEFPIAFLKAALRKRMTDRKA